MKPLSKINPKNILVINTFGIGDVLFTNPFVRSLKAMFPEARISYLANRRAYPILNIFGVIDEIFIYERDEYHQAYKKSKIGFYQKASGFLNELKERRFDTVFDFSLNSMINFLTWKVKIPHRIGFNYKNRGWLLTHKVDFSGFEGKHVVEHYLELLESLGLHISDPAMKVHLGKEDKDWVSEFFTANKVKTDRKIIGIFPGAGASWGKQARFRRWNIDKYAELLDKIVEKHNAQIILMGDKSEEEACRYVASQVQSPVIQAVGQTSITQLAALMATCDLNILNDGGPLHIAVASGAKTVSIFGPVDENVYGPFQIGNDHKVVSHDIACRPCYRRFRMTDCEHISCLKHIDVNDVLRKVDEIL